jgi:hypothetical protein
MRYRVETLKEDGDNLVTLGQQEREVSLIEFFFGELGSTWFGLVPPLHVLNYFLAHGSHGTADLKEHAIHHIYEWTPFEVTHEQYRQIVEALRQLPGRPFAEVEPPSDIRTVPEYEHWSFVRWMETKHGDYQKQQADA